MSVRGELHINVTGDARILTLDTPRFSIGRGPENSLCIPSTVVSRLHAEVIRVGQDFLLRDLGSTNGCYVNGTRISEQMLNDGDLLRFGNNGPEVSFRLLVAESGEYSVSPRHPQSDKETLISSLTGRLKIPQNDVCEEANLRRVLAEAHLNKGEYQRALEIMIRYNDVAALATLPVEFRANALLMLGRIYLERKEAAPAIDALNRALSYFQEASEGKGDDTGLAATHGALARAMLNAGKYTDGRDHLNRAMASARRAGNVRLRAETHLLIGKADWKEGDFEGARYNWDRASRLAEETNDEMLLSRLALQQALLLYTEGKLKDAVPAYLKAIELVEKTGNVRLLLKAYAALTRVHTRLGAWPTSEKLIDERLRIARQHQIVKAEAVALTDLAELKLLQGDLTTAQQTIQLAMLRHGLAVYARTQRILGRIMHARRQLPTAVEAYEKGLSVAREQGAIEEQVLLNLELALALTDLGDFQKAKEQLNAAEAATSLDPALNLMGRALYTRGAILNESGQLNEANRFFGQSLSIFQTVGDPYRTAVCHSSIGALRLAQNRLESARAHLEAASQAFARLGAMLDVRRVEALLSSTMLSNVQGAMTTMLQNAMGGTAQLSLQHKITGSDALPTTALQPIQNILVAVANDEIAGVLKRGLEVENYVVERVLDGRAAIEKVTAQPGAFHLLILDALLEHKSGFDVCRDLRKNKRETPVILLGGRQGLEDKIEALQSGADDFLSKRNLVFEELQAKVEALLR
jgi:tetratricopeptide (TPR) repeat protein